MIKIEMTPSDRLDDATLVADSLAGDRDTFRQIVERYQNLIVSLAYSATGDVSRSEDLAQETFVTAWKKLAELREPDKLRPWLCGIVRFLISKEFRRLDREPAHAAETLAAAEEHPAPEPPPSEHAISREEQAILWRSLERIPETYREPLVLFYREHQSVEVVAQQLELTEETVRQRLSRGRKLLQEEVLAFVEGALEKTAPGTTFAVAVLAALPVAVTSAKAASIGAAVAKGGTAAKGMASLAGLGGLLAMIGAHAFSWKTIVDDSKSPRERRLVTRMALRQVIFFAVCLLGITFLSIRMLSRPWTFATVLALMLLVITVNGVLVMPYLFRRRMEIQMQDGTFTETMEAAERRMDRILRSENGLPDESPPGMSKADATRRTIKLCIPFLIMVGIAIVFLPWKQHGWRSGTVIAGNGLILAWFFFRTRKQLRFPNPSRTSRSPAFILFVKTPLILLGGGLLGGALGYVLPSFLYPGSTKTAIHWPTWLGPFGVCLVIALGMYAVFIALFSGTLARFLPQWKWLTWLSDLPLLQSLQTMGREPGAVLEKTYAPLAGQIRLDPDRRVRLKELVLKRTMVGVRAGLSLMGRLDAEKRAAGAEKFKAETDGYNAQIRELLGDADYTVFQQFEKTIPDRELLSQLNAQLGKTAALSPAQEAEWLQALTAAREQFPWTTDQGRRNWGNTDLTGQLTEDNFNAFVREEEQFDRQFLVRAQPILRPEQLRAFERVQERRRRLQAAQHKLAAKLLFRR